MKFTASAIVLYLFLSIQAAGEKTIPVIRKMSGSFLTNVKGSSVSQPPYIQVIRSREGLEYTLSRFERLMNKTTQRRIDKLRKRLANVNYKKHMLVWVFSQPMDNFIMNLESIVINRERNVVTANVTYQHKIKNFRIPPYKSIHYVVAVASKSDLPVILNAVTKKTTKKKKPQKLITVTGRLMTLNSGNDLQLVPVVIKRGSKNSYYIRGDQAEPLRKHAGKVVTLKGTVSRERDSPYEWDLTVSKLVKVFP